jgi:hypothetical protein
MRIAWNFLLNFTLKPLQVFANLMQSHGPGRDVCGVSYTIAFHVAVFDEAQRFAQRR